MNHVSHLYRNFFIIIILIRKSYPITAKTAVTAAITLFLEYQPLFTPINSFFSPKLFFCLVANTVPALLFVEKLDWLSIPCKIKPDVK